MKTEFKFGYGESLNPRKDGVAVTPSDTVNLPYTATGIWVGTLGDVALETPYGSTLVFLAVPAGTLLPVCAVRVNETDTSADNMVALF